MSYARKDRPFALWAAAAAFLSLVTDVVGMFRAHMSWSYHTISLLWFLALATSLLVGSLLTSRPARKRT